MVYNATIDTGTALEKSVLHALQKKQKGVEFRIPPGYMTGNEFERRVKEGLRKKLKENGYLE